MRKYWLFFMGYRLIMIIILFGEQNHETNRQYTRIK